VRKNGSAIDPAATYTVTCNNFLAGGGDGFTLFTQGTNNVGGAVDLDALIAYIEGLSQPFTAVLQDRIVR
jgi:5'-nucleotidase